MRESRFTFLFGLWVCKMRERWRKVDKGWLLVLLLGLLAAYPFVSRAGLPQETDAELHIFRLAELYRLVAGGEIYPRWSPNFYYGYGYPIFNYYAPLVYYLGLGGMFLLGVTAVQGVKGVFVGGLLLAGWGMYGLVRENWGRRAGTVAAAVYLFAPYVQFVDAHARGDLAESFSLGLLPWGLWLGQRWMKRKDAGTFLATVLVTTAIILAHNLMAMVFFAILVAWIGWLTGCYWFEKREKGFAKLFVGFLPLLCGVGVGSFFWLPVALERNAVNLNRLIGSGSHFDFHNHFLSLFALLQPSHWLDWSASEPDFALNLGIAQWLLGGLGAGLLLWRRSSQRSLALFFVLAAVLLMGLMLPWSVGVWEWLPLLSYLQFPWRLLGATAAMLAVLAGGGMSVLGGRWGHLLAMGLALLPALPLTQLPPWNPDFGATSSQRVAEIEKEGRWLGTTSTADFVPATVEDLPRPNEELLQQLLSGQTVDRVNRYTLPAEATVIAQTITPLRTHYTISSPDFFLLRLYQFAFPGWQVTIDDQPIAHELALPEGFITIPIPAGEHQVEVWFGTTPTRSLAVRLSWLSLVLSLGLAWLISRRFSSPQLTQTVAEESLVGQWAVVLLICLLFLGWWQPAGLLHRQGLPALLQTNMNWNNEIALVGLEVAPHIELGQKVEIVLYWQAQQKLLTNYQVFVHLLDAEGQLWAQSDKLNPGDYPTERWSLAKYVRDKHLLEMPAQLPPGEYQITTGLWQMSTGARLPLLAENGQPIGDYFILRYLTIP